MLGLLLAYFNMFDAIWFYPLPKRPLAIVLGSLVPADIAVTNFIHECMRSLVVPAMECDFMNSGPVSMESVKSEQKLQLSCAMFTTQLCDLAHEKQHPAITPKAMSHD